MFEGEVVEAWPNMFDFGLPKVACPPKVGACWPKTAPVACAPEPKVELPKAFEKVAPPPKTLADPNGDVVEPPPKIDPEAGCAAPNELAPPKIDPVDGFAGDDPKTFEAAGGEENDDCENNEAPPVAPGVVDWPKMDPCFPPKAEACVVACCEDPKMLAAGAG